jgi:hypothetical protein
MVAEVAVEELVVGPVVRHEREMLGRLLVQTVVEIISQNQLAMVI